MKTLILYGFVVPLALVACSLAPTGAESRQQSIPEMQPPRFAGSSISGLPSDADRFQAQGPGGDVIPGRYVVMLKKGESAASVAAAHGFAPDAVWSAAINGFAAPGSANQARSLAGDPRVLAVEPDRWVRILGKAGSGGTGSSQTLPTGVDRVDAKLGFPASAGVGIAVIDTGVGPHTDLNIQYGPTYVSGTKSSRDDNGHGTHVAGIAAAMNNSIGVVGVAPGATIWAVKVLNRNGSGYLSSIISGVDWVTANASAKGIRVANMSLGGQFSSAALDTAIANSVAAGVIYAVAAGNDGVDAATFSPANHPDVVTVSAIADSDGKCGGLGAGTSWGADDTFARFSNFGSRIEIAAPGVNIYSTYKGGGYAYLSGTSMASPHVAGAVARLVLSNPASTSAEIVSRLLAVATPQSGACGYAGDPDAYPEPLLAAGNL